MADRSDIAQRLLLGGLQHWGQSDEERVQAWQDACDFMGLSVTLGVGEHGGRKVFTTDGPDAIQAEAFIDEVRQQFPLGKFEVEQKMIEECLEKYRKKA